MTIVHSKLLSNYDNLVCAMSTRNDTKFNSEFGLNMSYHVGDNPIRVKENRNEFFRELNISEDSVANPQQKHTTNVIICSSPGNYPNCDALITSERKLFLSITVADCTPIMLYDPRSKVIAAVHAGWRGTQQRIVEKTVQKMIKIFNTSPENIVAFIGPCADSCCYEVGEEVAKFFSRDCIHEKKNGKFLLDLKFSNVTQLLENNVQESHIETHPECTIHNNSFHSFRRDGQISGRMLAIIGLRN